MDRRIGKTRKALQLALVQSMLEKDFDAITVQDIIDRADVSRSTFYAHFTDKYQLFGSGFGDLTAQVGAAIGSARRFGFALPFLEHCHSHRDLYRVLSRRPQSGAMVRDTFAAGLRELVREDLDRYKDAPDFEARVSFLVGAFVGLVTWWLDAESPLSPAQVEGLYRAMAEPGLPPG